MVKILRRGNKELKKAKREDKDMKRKTLAFLTATAMIAAMSTSVFATDVEPEYDPNPDYAKYTVVEYEIEDLGAELVCTVCVNEDETEYEILCNFFDDDQDWVGSYDAEKEEVETKSDKTGFMEGDAPKIIKKALEQEDWVTIGEEGEEGEEGEDAELPAEPEYDPNPDYAKFTVVEYEIEDLGAELVCTVCVNEDETEYEILCNFFDDDQDWVGSYDAEKEEVETKSDKTGFMEGDAPKIIKKAIEQKIWKDIE